MRLHYIITLVVLLLHTWGCERREVNCESCEEIVAGQQLRSGDILLARCSGFLPAVFASLGEPRCDYGHAAVYFHDEVGCGRILHMQPGGVAMYSVSEFKEKYYKIGLVRHSEELNLDWGEFDRQCQSFLQYNKEHKICNDFWSESTSPASYRVEKYPDYIYCLSLINMLFYRADFPEPFKREFDISENPVINFIGKALGRKNFTMPTVASVFSNCDYDLVAEYHNSEDTLELMVIDDAIVERVNRYLREGYSVARVPLMKRPLLGVLYGIKIIVTPVLPSGTKTMVQKIDTYDKLGELYMMNRYIKEVRKLALASMKDYSVAEISLTVGDIADSVREKYFRRLGSVDSVD